MEGLAQQGSIILLPQENPLSQTPAARTEKWMSELCCHFQEGLEAEATRMTGCRKPVSFTVIGMDIQKAVYTKERKGNHHHLQTTWGL